MPELFIVECKAFPTLIAANRASEKKYSAVSRHVSPVSASTTIFVCPRISVNAWKPRVLKPKYTALKLGYEALTRIHNTIHPKKRVDVCMLRLEFFAWNPKAHQLFKWMVGDFQPFPMVEDLVHLPTERNIKKLLCRVTSGKNKLGNGKFQPFEDIFPIENVDFPLPCQFTRGYQVVIPQF